MESYFTPFLSTNYVPSENEIDEILNLLVDPINQLVQIDTKIARLQNIIDQLSLKRTQLHTDIAGHRALITPMRRIPQELLQEIFIRCLPAHHNAVMSCREAPLLLGRVCGQWRRVSRSTPRLWSSIHLSITVDEPPRPWNDPAPVETSTDDGSLYEEAVQAWLSRSGGLPLSISLFCISQTYPSGYKERLISSLFQFSDRWRNLSLFASSTSLPLLLSLSREAVPLLETFSFHNSAKNTLSPTLGIPPLDIFRAPLLRTASSSHLKMIPEDMNWARLTSLTLESHEPGVDELTPSRALGILRSCPNLTHCRLEFGRNPTLPLSDDAVTMPLLETLSINEGTSSLNSFFEHLRLPALVNLEFTPSPPKPFVQADVGGPSIVVLLRRLDSLRELTLSTNNLHSTTLMRCLGHIPYITRLSILNSPPFDWRGAWPNPINFFSVLNDEVVALLTPLTSTVDQPLQILCPRLKVLECNQGGVSDAVLHTFIQQRTTHALLYDIQHLEKVDINFRDRQREMDILAALPPEVLAKTHIKLSYPTHISPPKNSSPWAGLEEPGRLELPTRTSRFLFT